MNASKTPGTADPELLNVIEDLLNACRDASALLVGVAEEEERRFKRNAAMNVRDVEKALTSAICRGMSVCGEQIPSGRVSRLAVDPQAVRDAAPELLDALQAVSLTVAIHAGQHPGDREAQQDLAKVRTALRKATTVRDTPATTSPTIDPAHGGPGGGMGDAAAALPVCGCSIGNELHSRPLTRGEAAVGQKLDVKA